VQSGITLQGVLVTIQTWTCSMNCLVMQTITLKLLMDSNLSMQMICKFKAEEDTLAAAIQIVLKIT
jgi:hypothetical protein